MWYGFISSHHAQILHNNALINLHSLEAARENGVERYLYTSSACVYPEYKQTEVNVIPLKEEDAYPAQPQDAYGWEKLITERLCLHYREDYGLKTHIVRFHNIFGPLGWEPEISLEEGLARTYIWTETQVRKALAVKMADDTRRKKALLEAF